MPLGKLIIWNSIIWALAIFGFTIALKAVGETDAFLGILFVDLGGFLATNTLLQRSARR